MSFRLDTFFFLLILKIVKKFYSKWKKKKSERFCLLLFGYAASAWKFYCIDFTTYTQKPQRSRLKRDDSKNVDVIDSDTFTYIARTFTSFRVL